MFVGIDYNCTKMWLILIFIFTGVRSASVKHVLYGNNMDHSTTAPTTNSHFSKNSNSCNDMSDNELRQILGPAFNPRYMSINEPVVANQQSDNGGMKRTIYDYSLDFYVDNTFQKIDSEIAAWDVKYYELPSTSESDHPSNRNSRSLINNRKKDSSFYTSASSPSVLRKPWECESQIRWLDLGREYFPRYLRTVECLAHDCWYGHYTCKPRSFTVKILRRRYGNCAPIYKTGQAGLPQELRQTWIWEERAVNFCCDCAV